MEWQLLGERDGPSVWMHVVTRRYRLPSGRVVEWDVLLGGRSVAILALTADERVVMVRQFRPGPGRTLLELPGGMIDDDEPVESAAARELLEETGYSGDVELVGSDWLASNISVQRFVCIARGCTRLADPTVAEGELGELELVSLADFRTHLRSGQLTDVDLGYLALDHLQLL